MSAPSQHSSWPPLETAQSSLLGLLAFTAAIAPLALPPLVVALFVVTWAQNRFEGSGDTPVWRALRHEKANWATLAFILWATLSTTWSSAPVYGLKSLAQCILVALSTWYVAAALPARMYHVPSIRRRRFIRALPIAASFIGVYFIWDALTADGVTLFFARNFHWIFDGFENAIVYSKDKVPIGFNEIYFNRIAAALVLLTPGLAAALRFWPWPTWGALFATTATVGVFLICLRSGSATAILSAVFAASVAGLAFWSSRLTTRLLQIMFVCLSLAAIPLSMLPKAAGLDTHAHLPFSFRERVVMWNDLSHVAWSRPWFGIGAKSLKSMTEWPSKLSDAYQPERQPRAYVHPHNGYLQVWLEFGVLGALLFAAAGSLLIGWLTKLPGQMQPYVLAMAAATMAIIGPGWELWQPWLIAAIGAGWIVLMPMRREFEASITPNASTH